MTLANQTECSGLMRLLGVAFTGEKDKQEWEREQEEARRRDHRRIGTVREKSGSCALNEIILRGKDKTVEDQMVLCMYELFVYMSTKDQELFFFNDVSPGSCFFLPKGAHIYNTLTDFIKVTVHTVASCMAVCILIGSQLLLV